MKEEVLYLIKKKFKTQIEITLEELIFYFVDGMYEILNEVVEASIIRGEMDYDRNTGTI